MQRLIPQSRAYFGRALVPACVLSGTTQQELQIDLQLAASRVELGGSLGKPGCEPRPAAANASPGAT